MTFLIVQQCYSSASIKIFSFKENLPLRKICRKRDLCLENFEPQNPPIWAEHTRTSTCDVPSTPPPRECLANSVLLPGQRDRHFLWQAILECLANNICSFGLDLIKQQKSKNLTYYEAMSFNSLLFFTPGTDLKYLYSIV